MRMQTATVVLSSKLSEPQRHRGHRKEEDRGQCLSFLCVLCASVVQNVFAVPLWFKTYLPLSPLLFLLLPLLGALLGALAVAGVALGLEHLGAAGSEGSHFIETGHHFQPFPHAHLHHVAHERAHLVEG